MGDGELDYVRGPVMFCALYYKTGGYVGISFFRTLDHDALRTSVAQVFNERGEGVIVRGRHAHVSKEDLLPISTSPAPKCCSHGPSTHTVANIGRYLPGPCATKASNNSEAEKRGFRAGTRASNIDAIDLLSLRRCRSRAYRLGAYPPLRGTAIRLSETESLLYTQGSVDFYQCYPGLYVPRPLHVLFDDVDQGEVALLSQILALSKMNWNSTRFVNAEPVTVAAARNVGDVLRY